MKIPLVIQHGSLIELYLLHLSDEEPLIVKELPLIGTVAHCKGYEERICPVQLMLPRYPLVAIFGLDGR